MTMTKGEIRITQGTSQGTPKFASRLQNLARKQATDAPSELAKETALPCLDFTLLASKSVEE
jgi:hypothetical protein